MRAWSNVEGDVDRGRVGPAPDHTRTDALGQPAVVAARAGIAAATICCAGRDRTAYRAHRWGASGRRSARQALHRSYPPACQQARIFALLRYCACNLIA